MWLRGFFISFLFFLVCSSAEENDNTKIVGGETTSISNAGFMVQLFIDGQFMCGGSLVKGNVVVTAAHCVKGIMPRQLTIKGGATYLTDAGVQRGVRRVVLPKAYNENTLYMDVAVLILKTTMHGNNITIVKLRTKSVPDGLTVKVLGWGLTRENGNVSNRLRRVDLTRISKANCRQFYSGRGDLTRTMTCATRTHKDSCNGDSGGPLLVNNRLAGIVSWGYGCATAYPGVYTDVTFSRVNHFITSSITKFA